MSVGATTWAWQQAAESSGQRLVLLALADACGGDEDDARICWPSVARITRMVGLADAMVRRHMERLVEMGLISKVERRRRRDGSLGTWTVTVNFTSATLVTTMTSTTATGVALDHRYSSSAHEPSSSEPPEVHTVASGIETLFEQWWAMYPRKVSRKQAFTKWKNFTNSERSRAMGGLVEWAAFWKADRTETIYIPHPTTWLRDARWDAEPPWPKNARKEVGWREDSEMTFDGANNKVRFPEHEYKRPRP